MKRERAPKLMTGAGAVAALTFAFLYLPIVTLVVLSFNAGDLTTIWGGASAKWYAVVLANDDILRATKNSLITATTASAVGTATALAAALGVIGIGRSRRAFAESLLGLPLLVPEIVTAVALLMTFVIIGFPLGLTSVIVAHTVFCIPFAYYPIRSRLEALDPALMEAASDLYASHRQRFLRIELPLLAPGVIAGALLAFISSFGDFVITYFVAGPGATTLPVYVYGMIRVGVTPEVNALSAILLFVTIAVITVAFHLGRRPGLDTNGGSEP